MSPDQLKEYILVMREHNVTVFKTDGVQIELGPAPAKPEKRDPDAPVPAPRKNDYERLLFAATEGLSEEDA